MSGKRRAQNVVSALKKDKLAIFSILFLIIVILLALFAPVLPIDPAKTDVHNILKAPSLEHPFGTDEIGRDYMARVIYGGRVSLLVGVLAMLACVSIGIVVGTAAGYYGGLVDSVLMRVVDVMSSIPWLILVTVISLFIKRGLRSIIIVIGFFTWMQIARLVRAETLTLKEREYVQYAKLIGLKSHVIILRHVIPAVSPTIIIASSTSIANAIMTESSLSFLGLGIQQPMASWGSLLQSAQGNMQNAIYMAILPGLLIVMTVFAFNKLGNLLRIYVEPAVSAGEKE